jgi:hypothetical protein
MKSIIIMFVLEKVFDLFADTLEELADRTSTTVDDKMVKDFRKYKNDLMNGARRRI